MPQNLVKVYTGSSINVLAIMNALESDNIYPLIKDRSESARLAGFGATSICLLYTSPSPRDRQKSRVPGWG